MNREIKFRAWDGNKSLKFDCIMIYADGIGNEVYIDREQIASNVTLLQYTGLKDKNGVEIYEGDIIRCSATQREINYVLENDVVKVQYSNGYFYPFGYNAGWRSEVYDIEVIGNIYENPELLK